MITHHYGYRCTGRQASCTCGFRGKVHSGPSARRKAQSDLKAHAADVKRAKEQQS